MAELHFNPQEHRPSDGTRKLLPEGDYVGIIEEAEVKENSKKNGSYLQVKIQIVSGEHQGEIVYDTFNLQNPSDKAVKVAQESLTALCYALGRVNPISKTEDLIGPSFNFKLKVEPASKGPDGKEYPPKNLVARYLFDKSILNGGVPAKAATPKTVAATEGPGRVSSDPSDPDFVPF